MIKRIALLNYIGIALLVCALFILMKDNAVVGAVILVLSIALMIPDYWLFIIEAKKMDEPLTPFWITKFIGLVLCFILSLFFLIMEMFGINLLG